MRFYADLHIHSKHSRACSQDLDIPGIAQGAKRKGITVVGLLSNMPYRGILELVFEAFCITALTARRAYGHLQLPAVI
jgi:predicted metal-dependent phosphoesterase TrpH